MWRDTAATPAKRYKIQEISCDTCSATGGTRNRVQLSWGVAGECLTRPSANPLVAERAPWRSSQSCVTGGQQHIGNPYRFLSFCTPGNPCATPIVTRGEGSFSYQGVSTRGVRHAPVLCVVQGGFVGTGVGLAAWCGGDRQELGRARRVSSGSDGLPISEKN